MPIVLNGNGPVTGLTSLNTTVSDTELGYLDGVTSAIQTQINTAGGLVKITDQSFSAVSSVSVNNCFSSTYENYRVVISNIISASGQPDVYLRLRVSGSDNSTAGNYRYGRFYYQIYGTNSGSNTNVSDSFFQVAVADTDTAGNVVLDIFQPFATARTSLTLLLTGQWFQGHGGQMTVNTSYTGFTFFTSALNISGTIRVYGYRN
jgi:hypothetical protein